MVRRRHMASRLAAAGALARRYREISVATAIIAGEADEIVETPFHSIRLAEHIPGATLHLLPEMGHMLHHFEAETLADVLHDVAARGLSRGEGKSLGRSLVAGAATRSLSPIWKISWSMAEGQRRREGAVPEPSANASRCRRRDATQEVDGGGLARR
jgi:hypothetical protein